MICGIFELQSIKLYCGPPTILFIFLRKKSSNEKHNSIIELISSLLRGVGNGSESQMSLISLHTVYRLKTLSALAVPPLAPEGACEQRIGEIRDAPALWFFSI